LTVHAVDLVHRPLQRQRQPVRGLIGCDEQLQLRVRLDQPVRRDRHRPHRRAPPHREGQRQLRCLPELGIERLRGEWDAPRVVVVVGVFHPEREPPRREAPPPEPPAQRLGEPAQQSVQHVAVVGVGGERMGEPVLGPRFRRQHRPRVDAAHLGAKQPAPAAEDGAELGFGDGRDLADPLELVLVEPLPDVLGDFGEHAHWMRGEEGGLVTRWTDGQTERRKDPAPLCPSFRLSVFPSQPGCRFGDELIDRHPGTQRQPEPLPGLPPDPLGDVHRRAEQPLGTGEVEERVSKAAGLDDRRVDPEDLVQGSGGSGIEPGVGWEQHQIGAELAGPAHQHPPRHPRRLRLGRERQDGGPVRPRRRHGDRPAPERRGDQPLHRGAEGGGVDENDGLHAGGPLFRYFFGRYYQSIYLSSSVPISARRGPEPALGTRSVGAVSLESDMTEKKRLADTKTAPYLAALEFPPSASLGTDIGPDRR
jgi:hypothetical protein